jgi:hypothetical protein
MISITLIVCLQLAVPSSPQDPRLAWTEKLRAVQPSWDRKELDAFLEKLRGSVSRLNGGGFHIPPTKITYFDLYALDETYALYVVWKDHDVRKGIESTEVVAFSDLRPRIEPGLFDVLATIQRSPSAQQGLDFNPLALIRAVNTLQALGKEKALKALWAYDRLVQNASPEERFKQQLDEYRILPIVQVLFEGPHGRMPPFALGGGDVEPAGASWPRFPIVLVQDVPFMMISGYMLTGKPQKAIDHLRLELGPLREPLAPRVTALEAADELTESPAWKALRLGPGNEGRKRWQIRRQALAAVHSAFTPRTEETTNDCCVDPTETQWRWTVDRAKASGLLWSPEIQNFIIGR